MGLVAPGVGGAEGAPVELGALPLGFPIGWGTRGEGFFFPPFSILWLAILVNQF